MSKGSYTVLQLDAASIEERTKAVQKFNDEMANLSESAAKLLGQCWEHDHEELRRKSMRKHVCGLLWSSFCWLLGVVVLTCGLAYIIRNQFGPPIGVWAYVLLIAFMICCAALPAALLILSFRGDDT